MGRALAIAALVCWALLGCTPVYRVHQQRTPEFDLAQAQSYEWLVVESADADTAGIARRVEQAVDSGLERKGLARTSAAPSFLVAVRLRVRQRPAEAPDPYQAAYGPYTAPPEQFNQEGTLVVEIVAPDENQVVWRGSASVDLSEIGASQAADVLIDAVVVELLNNFPPT